MFLAAYSRDLVADATIGKTFLSISLIWFLAAYSRDLVADYTPSGTALTWKDTDGLHATRLRRARRPG